MKSFRFWLTVFSVLTVIINAIGWDRDNLLFFTFSIPVWLVEIFQDAHTVNTGVLYITTIASWYLLGLIADRLIRKRTRNHVR